MGDLLDPEYLKERLENALAINNRILSAFGEKPVDIDEPLFQAPFCRRRLRPFITDTSVLLDKAIDAGKKVVFEGAQGSLLDLDHGTYPFVTSSSPTSVSIPVNAGVAPP